MTSTELAPPQASIVLAANIQRCPRGMWMTRSRTGRRPSASNGSEESKLKSSWLPSVEPDGDFRSRGGAVHGDQKSLPIGVTPNAKVAHFAYELAPLPPDLLENVVHDPSRVAVHVSSEQDAP